MAAASPLPGPSERPTRTPSRHGFVDLATRNALRIALIYVVLGFTWILLSDRAVDAFIADPGTRSLVSTIKGWAYVTTTGLLLFVLVQRDLAGELRIRRALEASERRLRALLEAVDLCAVVLDRHGRIRFANGFLAHLLGRARDDLVGLDWFEAAVPESGRNAQRHLFERIMAGTASAGRNEGDLLAAQGVRRIAWHCAALHDADGAIIGLAAIGHDLTEQRRLEAHLQRVERMDAIGQLAGGIAHDFNNLLTVIGGHADLIAADASPGSSIAAEAAEIRAAVDRASGFTRQLLAVSRGQPLEPRPVDLGATVAGIAPMLRRALGETIELVVEAGEGCWVEADPAQLEQVILNLAVNARDAMSDGGRLTISVSAAEAGSTIGPGPDPLDEAAVVLTVRDTGAGMTPEVAARAFEPFFTTKPTGMGTGLGLATVYGIVRQSGGEVFLDTAPGRGTTVTITLPRIEPSLVPGSRPPARDAASIHATILLVEDDSSVRSLVRRILESDGYPVLEAADAGAAEELARSLGAPPDLLVTDVVLPDVSGPELGRRLRERWPALPIILVSGYAPPEAGLETAAEPWTFLPKPFSPEQLRTAVRAALRDQDRRRADGAA